MVLISSFFTESLALAELTIGCHESAYRFGKLALKLQETIDSKASICPTFGFTLTLLTYRKEPLADLKHQLLKAGSIGFEVGTLSRSICFVVERARL